MTELMMTNVIIRGGRRDGGRDRRHRCGGIGGMRHKDDYGKYSENRGRRRNPCGCSAQHHFHLLLANNENDDGNDDDDDDDDNDDNDDDDDYRHGICFHLMDALTKSPSIERIIEVDALLWQFVSLHVGRRRGGWHRGGNRYATCSHPSSERLD